MSQQKRTTFIHDKKGEVVMLNGSPRSLKRRYVDFNFKRKDFRQMEDGTMDDILCIHHSITN